MFHGASNQILEAAHEAATHLYKNHRMLGLDEIAVRLATLSSDIEMELEDRAGPITTVGENRAEDQPARDAPVT